ncbi:MAG: response regulator [Lachnospirales bacterium]
MYKTLIIDDEELTRVGIKKHINWHKYNINQVELAGTAEDALKVCINSKPDIIISDIKMAKLNGIDLSKKIRQILPNCQIIFISAYTDKKYLKEAIGLQVVDYVEKPIDLNILGNSIQNAVNKVESNVNVNYHNKLKISKELFVKSVIACRPNFNLIENDNSKKFISIILFLKNHNYTKDMLIHKMFEANFNDLMIYQKELDLWVIIASCDNNYKSNFSENVKKYIKNEKYFIAIGTLVDKKYILDSYQSSVIAYKEMFFKGYNNIIFYYDLGELKNANNNIFVIESEFKNAVMINNEKQCKNLLIKLYMEFKNFNQIHVMYIKNKYIRFYEILTKKNELSSVCEKIIGFETLREIHEFIMECCFNAFKNKRYSWVVKKTINIIQEKYTYSGLSIKDIADEIFLSPSHISRTFKQETSKTIGQYLLDYRIEKAMEYLLDPNLKLYQVGIISGFNSASYFADVFKKKVGITPSAYRDRHIS